MMTVARIKYGMKLVVAHGLYALGILQLWQRIVLRRRAVVLMYHRVLTADERTMTASHPAIVVERETFAAHMALVGRRFNVMTVDQFVERIERRIPFENSSCLVTFDDGWHDNYRHALPILSRHRIPALIFLPVNYIGEQRLFWQEALVHGLQAAMREARQNPSKAAFLREIVAPLGLEEVFDLADVDPRRRIIGLMTLKRKRFNPADVDAVLTQLDKEVGSRNAGASAVDGFLTWEQVAAMSKDGVRFGGHGAEHHLLSHLSPDESREDIERCKAVMASHLKEEPLAFTYPRGYWTPQVVELVKKAGYRLAFIAKGGSVACEDDPYTLRRINICQEGTETAPLFLARIVGLF